MATTTDKTPKSPETGKPARGPEIVGAAMAEKAEPRKNKAGEPLPTLAKNDGPPETLQEEIAAGNATPERLEMAAETTEGVVATDGELRRAANTKEAAAAGLPTVADIVGEAEPEPAVIAESPATEAEIEAAERLEKRQKREQADAIAKANEDIEAARLANNDPPKETQPPFLENDPLNDKAVADAQAAADALFEQGVAEAEIAEQPFIEPSEEEIRAQVLGEVETKRHEYNERLAATATLDPHWQPERKASHASARARSRGQ